VAAATRLYVRRIDAASNRIEVGARDDLFSRDCRVRDVHWIAGSPPAAAFSCACRLRYRQAAVDCDVSMDEDGTARVHVARPQFAITPGQAAVFYAGDEVLGGGWIADAGPG
jgi:tRNA-specific 2-thiouridylase